MGEVKSIFADGRLHRQLLDRITRLVLDYMNGSPCLRLTATGDVNYHWITDHVIFRFIVNGGERTLTGRCWELHRFTNEDNVHCARIEFRDPKTGREEPLGEWKTLEIIFVANKQEKSFVATREDKTREVKETS